MTNPYTKPTITGYNADPPPDDGTVSAANQLNWSKHKDKLADPIKTFVDAINDETSDAFQSVVDNPAVPRGYISGYITSNGTDTNHDIDITAGTARDSANLQTLTRTTSITKQIDSDWVEGTAAGGFPSGLTLSASTWYHIFLIWKTDGTVDAGFDTSVTATNLLADATAYSRYRRIGAVATDGSNNILAYRQNSGWFRWRQPIEDIDVTNPGTGVVSRALSAPLGVKTLAQMTIWVEDTAATNQMLVSEVGTPNGLASATSFTIEVTSDNRFISHDEWTDTNSSVHTDFVTSTASTALKIITKGWWDPRGQDD